MLLICAQTLFSPRGGYLVFFYVSYLLLLDGDLQHDTGLYIMCGLKNLFML